MDWLLKFKMGHVT